MYLHNDGYKDTYNHRSLVGLIDTSPSNTTIFISQQCILHVSVNTTSFRDERKSFKTKWTEFHLVLNYANSWVK